MNMHKLFLTGHKTANDQSSLKLFYSLTATQHLYHKCHSVAEWTMEVNSKSGEEVKAYQEQSKKL